MANMKRLKEKIDDRKITFEKLKNKFIVHIDLPKKKELDSLEYFRKKMN